MSDALHAVTLGFLFASAVLLFIFGGLREVWEWDRPRRQRRAVRSTVASAVVELDAVHHPDDTGRMCVTCGAADGSWPCVSRMVADDLRGLIERDAS